MNARRVSLTGRLLPTWRGGMPVRRSTSDERAQGKIWCKNWRDGLLQDGRTASMCQAEVGVTAATFPEGVQDMNSTTVAIALAKNGYRTPTYGVGSWCT
jgi:hypothetical protein